MKFTALLLTVMFLMPISSQAREKPMPVQQGSTVSFDYVLTVDGQVIDSSENRGPLEYVHGQGQIIPGLSRQLEGMKEGDTKEIKVSCEEAYGQVNPQAFQEIPASSLPEGVDPQEGMVLQAENPQGQAVPVRVSEVKEDQVVLDFNHPLAGKDLNFKVTIVSVK